MSLFCYLAFRLMIYQFRQNTIEREKRMIYVSGICFQEYRREKERHVITILTAFQFALGKSGIWRGLCYATLCSHLAPSYPISHIAGMKLVEHTRMPRSPSICTYIPTYTCTWLGNVRGRD